MAVSLSTFAQTEQRFETVEPETPATPAQEPSATAVNENGSLENQDNHVPAPEAPDTPETPAEQQEENTIAFNLGVSEEKTEEQKTGEQSTQAAPTFNWKEEIKKLDPKELLKEIGVNDFAIEMNEYLAKGGKASDYITAKGFDWNNISDEELVKTELRQQFPDASELQISRLYNKKYNQREEDLEEDKEDGLLLMKTEARKIREEKITRQNSFKIPEAIIPQVKDEAYEQWKQQQEAQPALVEKIKTFYNEHEATKRLNESKRVTVSLADGVTYNFKVENPAPLINFLTDGGETWNKLTTTKTGEPDVAKQHLFGLFAHDPIAYSQAIFNYGMQMGRKKMVEEGQNPVRPQQKVQPPELNGNASYSTGKFGDRQRN